MVKVSMEVRSGAACFDEAVQAESIQRAVSFVKERLNYLADELGSCPSTRETWAGYREGLGERSDARGRSVDSIVAWIGARDTTPPFHCW